jgi:uncharacterized membrane protein (DUF4010 family)
MLELIQPFVISLSIGLLVGIERERAKARSHQAMGVRTFMLLALLGSIAGQISEWWMASAIGLFAAGAILLGYWRSTAMRTDDSSLGLTSEIAAAVVFGLGFMAQSQPLLTLILGVVVLVILLSRDRLHQFSRSQIDAGELRAAAIILVMTVVIAPFLPNRTIDPWALFNPRRFFLILIVLSVMQFGAYVALRAFGAKYGAPLMGFLGGLVSSTTVFLELSQRTKREPEFSRIAFVSGMYAQAATLVELGVLALAVHPSLGAYVTIPVAVMAVASAAATSFVGRSVNLKDNIIESKIGNPLDLRSAVKLAAIFTAALTIIALANRYAPSEAVFVLAALGGFVELQSTSMAALSLHADGMTSGGMAFLTVLTAVTASVVAKFAIVWGINRSRFARQSSIGLLLVLALGAAAAVLTYRSLMVVNGP